MKPKPELPIPAPLITSASTVTVKEESVPVKIQPYKKLPCRGDSVQTRIAKLQADPWSDASKLTAKSVFCRGCLKQVCLDKRFDYYPGFWETHKRRCQYVQRGQPKMSVSKEVKVLCIIWTWLESTSWSSLKGHFAASHTDMTPEHIPSEVSNRTDCFIRN